jgi:NADPH2:quinone reductase
MRALVFEGPSDDTTTTRIVELPEPEPGPGQVAIDVHHAGVNFKDIMARRGDQGYATQWPFVPGLEVAGTVRAVGRGVSGFDVGQAVAAYTGAGGQAEVAVADSALVQPVPDGVPLELAAAAPGALVTGELLLGRLEPGAVVLLHGASGGVGEAVARLARAGGARLVLGTVGSAARVQPALEAGYDRVFTRDASLVDAVMAATDGLGADLVLDPQGTTLLELDLELTAVGGRIVLFGNAAGTPFGPLPGLERLMAGNVSLSGFSLAALAARAPERVGNALRAALARLAGKAIAFDVTPIAGLERAAAAHQAMIEGRLQHKQVIAVR